MAFNGFEGSSVWLLDRKGIQKGWKTKSKQDSHGWSILWWIFIDLGSILGAEIEQKLIKNEVEKQCKKRSNQNGQGSGNEML